MKRNLREATVIMAKCKQTKQSFGIRTEKMLDNTWHCTWTFRLDDKAAANEGYVSTLVSGKIVFDEGYPGCPYCKSTGWFCCSSCGRLTCFENETTVTCSWCGNSGNTVHSDTFDLKGGGY